MEGEEGLRPVLTGLETPSSEIGCSPREKLGSSLAGALVTLSRAMDLAVNRKVGPNRTYQTSFRLGPRRAVSSSLRPTPSARFVAAWTSSWWRILGRRFPNRPLLHLLSSAKSLPRMRTFSLFLRFVASVVRLVWTYLLWGRKASSRAVPPFAVLLPRDRLPLQTPLRLGEAVHLRACADFLVR